MPVFQSTESMRYSPQDNRISRSQAIETKIEARSVQTGLERSIPLGETVLKSMPGGFVEAVRQGHNYMAEERPAHPKIQEMILANPLREVCQALADEMAVAQTDSSRAFEVIEGNWVSGSDDGHLYTFRTDIAILIPPETPVRIVVEWCEAAEGVLVAQHDFDVLLCLRHDLGEAIARARVSSEPWFIVAALRQ